MDEKKENLFTPEKGRDPYHVDEHIEDGNQKKWKRLIEIIISVIGWLYIVVYLVYVIYGLIAIHFDLPIFEIWFYNRAMLEETEELFIILAIAICIITIILLLWRTYNFRVFGKKDRRKFPKDVSDADLAEYFQLKEEEIKVVKTLKVIEFTKNVV